MGKVENLPGRHGRVREAVVKVGKSGVLITRPLNNPLVTNTMKDNGEVGAEANPERPDAMSVVNIHRLTRNARVGELRRKARNC